jgi:hypothetical protein
MKALTREDLLYILQSIFKLSKQLDNAFQMLEDGLYVKDYTQDLQKHTDDTNIHINADIRSILDRFAVDSNNNITYDGKYLNIVLSEENDNAIKNNNDGLYVKQIPEEVQSHLDNDSIHITDEERKTWNAISEEQTEFTKEYILNALNKLVLYDISVVQELPTENISSTTVYLLANNDEFKEQLPYIPYVNLMDKWIMLTISYNVLQKYAPLSDVVTTDNFHDHDNKDILDRITEQDGLMYFNDKNVSPYQVSEQDTNAIKVIDNELYVEDLKSTVDSLAVGAAFTKYNLLNQECNAAGKYDLKENINQFNLLLIEYYYKPDNEAQAPGNAKTVVVDPDTLNDLYEKGIDYIIELGYGISNSNCKFYMNKTHLYINYYHNICIYKITGIRGSGK